MLSEAKLKLILTHRYPARVVTCAVNWGVNQETARETLRAAQAQGIVIAVRNGRENWFVPSAKGLKMFLEWRKNK